MTSLKNVGLQDAAIDEENIKTISQMSEAEILQAQKILLEQLGQNHQGALKKFQSNFGKSTQVDKSEETKEPQIPKVDKGSIAQVEFLEVFYSEKK